MAGFNIKDIAGLGEIVGHIKDLLLKIIETISMREERKLRNEKLKLENAREFLDIVKKHDLTPEQLKYYESLANGTNPNLIQKSAHLIKAADNPPENRSFATKFSTAQTLSELHYGETKDS